MVSQYAEDRSPDLRSIQPPSQSRSDWIRLQWLDGSFTSGNTRAEKLFGSFASINDGEENRCAHSCGAVAEFHRLPEHPGDCVMSRAVALGSGSDGMETTSMTSTFIAGPVSEVNVENLVSKTGTPALKLPHSLASATSVFCWLAEPQLGLVGEGW